MTRSCGEGIQRFGPRGLPELTGLGTKPTSDRPCMKRYFLETMSEDYGHRNNKYI